jgi:flavodoxin
MGAPINASIVYDSLTGNTESAARLIAEQLRWSGARVELNPVKDANPAAAASADLLCVGSWTQGLFVILQHPTRATMRYIERLPPLHGKHALVFCSYALRRGSTLSRLASALEKKGAWVRWQVAFKRAAPVEGFSAFASELKGDGKLA